ncbi:MAG: thioredoxin domain-containing protein [Proteobacteria bacterium]|nr:thioredoxin domain-containing protein [Pseudomonadota bacterium]
MTDHNSTSEISNQSDSKIKLWWSAFVLALIGLALSAYSVKHHMDLRANANTDAVCNINASVNCDAVASSKYAEVFGYPVGVFGIGYFLAMGFFAWTIATNGKTSRENRVTWFALAAIGLMTSIILGSISLGVIQVVCVVCIATYVVTIGQAFVAYMLYRDSGIPEFNPKLLGNGATSAIVAVALSLVGYSYMKPAAQLPAHLQDLPGKFDKPESASLLPIQKDIPINRTAYSGVGEDYRLGNDDAKAVIVEFADYQCPACAEAKEVLDNLYKEMGNKILIVFKNYPLSNKCNSTVQSDMHPFSCDISRLARCAGQYGKFWEYHRMAFENQRSASLEKAKEWGRNVGMTEAQMTSCLNSPDILAKIQDDVGLGNKSGVDGTPTIFINGKKYVGQRTVADLRATIESLK